MPKVGGCLLNLFVELSQSFISDHGLPFKYK